MIDINPSHCPAPNAQGVGAGSEPASAPSGAFARATAVSRVDEGRYAATVDGGWGVGGAANGGYLLAIAVRAGLDALPHPHPVAVSGHFLRPPADGPASVEVEQLRAGRTVSSARVRLIESAGAVLDVLLSASDFAADGEPHDFARAPAMPPPEECGGGNPTLPGDVRIGLLDHVDVRLGPATTHRVGEAKAQSAAGRPPSAGAAAAANPADADGIKVAGEPVEYRGWVRMADGAEPDPLVAILAADALPPTVFRLGVFGWAPTVELTFLLRGLPAPGWLAVRTSTQRVAGGWFDENAEVWDSAGRLVGQARQLARVGRGG
jgi:acyl-CoA thioesterase